MKIVFFGTPQFAVPTLEILINNGYDIVAVVTTPDKKAGRGLKIKESAVCTAAKNHNLKVLQPLKLSDNTFIDELKSLNADLFIIVAFRMLPEIVWQMPPMGSFNLHSSLLPQYRGAAPINRAIMNGELKTGVTTFYLQHKIDTGNILFQESTNISENETAGELHDRLMLIGAELVLKTVKEIEKGNVNQTQQAALMNDEQELKPAPKLFPADCEINWNNSAKNVHNQIRGLSPFPGAFTTIIDANNQSLLLKLFRSQLSELSSEGKNGAITIIDKKLMIGCADYFLEITELQQEGKKRILASEFIKGFRTEKNWHCKQIN